jgi:hypothetical protein
MTRIRYNTEVAGVWTSNKPVTGNGTEYSVLIDTGALTFTIKNSIGELAFSGQGENLVAIKKNVRLAFETLGISLGSEKRNRTSKADAFDLDTHANLAAKVS